MTRQVFSMKKKKKKKKKKIKNICCKEKYFCSFTMQAHSNIREDRLFFENTFRERDLCE